MSEQDGPDQRWSSQRADPMFIVAVVAGVALLLFAVSALPVVLRGDGDSEVASLLPTVPSTPTPTPTPTGSTLGSVPLVTTPSSADTDSAATSTLGSLPLVTTPPSSFVAAQPPDEAPSTTTASTTTASTTADEVPESRAVVQGGKIYLEGAVPSEEAREEIVALAAEILGPDNVIDGYFVDERASDPNLGQVRVADAVLFELESAVIASEFEPLLNQGLALLTIRPSASFVIFGHTDSLGNEEYNEILSRERALAVVSWYIARGIDPARLSAEGRGELEPIASNETPEGRQQNRRIEVLIENLLAD